MNRIIRANILTNSLNLVNDKVLIIYHNKVEDKWYNVLVNKGSYNYLIIERVGYVYYLSGKGEGTARFMSDHLRNKAIQQHIGNLYYVHNFLPKNDNKKKIIEELRRCNGLNKYRLNFFRSKFYLLN